MQQQVQRRPRERERAEEQQPVASKSQRRNLDATDEILDEMDKLLEDTTVAENYQQKGGQ